MTNKEFTNLLNQEYETVLNVINKNSNPAFKKMLGAFAIADRVTDNNYAKLCALYNIMKKHSNLTNEQIMLFIKGKQSFKFLEKFINFSPNALEDLKDRGPIKMAEEYSTVEEEKYRLKKSSKPKPKPKPEPKPQPYDDGVFVDDTDDWMY